MVESSRDTRKEDVKEFATLFNLSHMRALLQRELEVEQAYRARESAQCVLSFARAD